MSFKNPPIVIIIPCFNEYESILNLISRMECLTNYNYRIIVIDDGSKDNSYERLKSHNLPKTKIYKNQQNMGKGFTLRHGFSLVKSNELVVVIDGDGEHYPEDIPLVIKPILNNEADMCVGSRFMKIKQGGQIFNGSYLNNLKKFSHIRKFGNFIFSMLIFIFHKKFLTDTQSGFRAFRPGLIKLFNFDSYGFQIETEITIKLLKKGWRIKEVPIHNGASIWPSNMKMILDSIKIIAIILELTLSEKMKKVLKSLLRKFYVK